jgi:hypothetical protein
MVMIQAAKPADAVPLNEWMGEQCKAVRSLTLGRFLCDDREGEENVSVSLLQVQDLKNGPLQSFVLPLVRSKGWSASVHGTRCFLLFWTYQDLVHTHLSRFVAQCPLILNENPNAARVASGLIRS